MGEPEFTQRRNAIRAELPDYSCLSTLEVSSKMFDYHTKLGIMVSINILSENIAKYKKPKTWWDAVKGRFFHKLLLVWFPVEYDTIKVDALYPNATFKDKKIIWKAMPG